MFKFIVTAVRLVQIAHIPPQGLHRSSVLVDLRLVKPGRSYNGTCKVEEGGQEEESRCLGSLVVA